MDELEDDLTPEHAGVRPASDGAELTEAMRRLADAISRLGVRSTEGVEVLLTPDELAEVLKLPARTVKDQLSAGRLPHHRFGKHYRFSPADVLEILRMTEKKPLADPFSRPRIRRAA